MLLLILGVEVYFILRRNRQIIVKGKDSFISVSLVLLLILLAFPVSQHSLMIENLRNSLLILAVVSTFAIKRGVSEAGLEKLFITIPWNKITQVQVSNYQIGKLEVLFWAGSLKLKLIFPRYNCEKLVYYLQQQIPVVYLEEGLELT